MRRKKTSKAAALAASSGARAAIGENGQRHPPGGVRRRDDIGRRVRTHLVVLVIFFGIRWILKAPNLMFTKNGSSDAPPGASNLSILPDMNSLPHFGLQSTFEDFYAANVQPLLDIGLSAFNGTNHDVGEESRVGYQLRQQNARAKHPVVMIPGFVTSGLELWEGAPCAKKHFRQRLWGSASMARTFFSDRECWRKHLALNPQTGMDPPNIRLRSAQGFEAADNFIATYWVWSHIIENLADVGYDGSTMTMMSYDWRMGYEFLEKRDGYFTKLKHTIEAHHSTTGEKVILISHSMGGTVAYYFLQWVVADAKLGGGGGGKHWIERHVHAFINIAGTLLGVPKAIPALLSGELKDTAMLLSQLGELLENYFGKRWRKNLWVTWGSLFGMLPKGGNAIWGVGADLTPTPQNEDSGIESAPAIVWNNVTGRICQSSRSPLENRTPTEGSTNDDIIAIAGLDIPPSRTWSMEETIDHLFKYSNDGRSSIYASMFSTDAKRGWKRKTSSRDKRKHWSDPLATQLPRAPSMSIYCLYGTGIPTERSYYYEVSCDKLGGMSTIDQNETCPDASATEEEAEPPEAPFKIDTDSNDESKSIEYGVRHSDGDGSVPLVSLGYMCQKWSEHKNPHNPSGIKVYTREKIHAAQVSLSDPGRGGPASGEHVDILGNVEMIEDVVRIATGFEVEEKVNKDIVESDLKKIVEAIDQASGA
ncbi:hypothetical protein ACHAWF_018526 [Thalassiosira exigua]